MTRLINPDQQYFDNDTGAPLALGTVYFGEPNQDPETNPKAVYADADLVTPLSPTQALTAAGKHQQAIYLDGEYSITVRDSGGSLISAEENFAGAEIGGGPSSLRSQLASTSGAGMVGFKRAGVAGAIERDALQKLLENISVADVAPADTVDATAKIQALIDAVFADTVDSPFINDSTNAGFKRIDLGGELWPLSDSLNIPVAKGGVIFANGGLKATADFPLGEPIIKYAAGGDNSDIYYIDMLIDCNHRANGFLFDTYIKNGIFRCHIVRQKDYGVKTQNIGYELYISDSFIEEYSNNETGFGAPTSTGLILGAGTSDNHVNNLVINYCLHPFEVYGQANAFNLLHVYCNGAIDLDLTRCILGPNAQYNRFSNCYWDTSVLEIQTPRNIQITGSQFAAGNAVNGKAFVVFKPTVANHEVVGVTITNNLFNYLGSTTCDAFAIDTSTGSFSVTGVKETRIFGNSRAGAVTLKGTRARKSGFASGSTVCAVDFSDRLLFGAQIQWATYMLNANASVEHRGSWAGQTVTITTNVAANLTPYVEVDTAQLNNGVP